MSFDEDILELVNSLPAASLGRPKRVVIVVVEQGPVRMAFEVYKNLNARLFLVCYILLAVFVIFAIIFQNLSREKKSQNCALRALLVFLQRALFFGQRDTFFLHCDLFSKCDIISIRLLYIIFELISGCTEPL